MRRATLLLWAVKIWALFAQPLFAGPYESSFRIACQEGAATSYGSGTAISEKHVVTNAHVVGNVAGGWVQVFNATGNHRGYVIAADTTVDLALIHIATGGLQAVPVAETDPKQGDAVTVWGYGRSGILRSGEGTVQPIRSMRAPSCPVVETNRGIEPGDSGGGMFNANGELCAVQWCSDGSSGNGAGRSGATPVSCLWTLTQKWETQCGNGQCLPWSSGRGIGIGISGYSYGQLAPRQQPAAPLVPVQPPAQRPQLPAQPAPAAKCDCDAKTINARLDKLEALGPKLDALAVQISTIKACECGPRESANLPTPERHIVIVADQSAAYWPRLESEINRAKGSYSGIRVAGPPTFAVPLPQIVAYEAGKPVNVIQGSRNVSDALSRVARGDVFFF